MTLCSPVPTPSAASGDLIGLSGPAPMKTCECRHRQSEWFAFNHELVMPEYVIDFEYLTRVGKLQLSFYALMCLLAARLTLIPFKFET